MNGWLWAILSSARDRPRNAPTRRWRSQGWWVLTIMVCVSALRGSAENAASAFDSANRLYEQGKFAEAAAGFEKLVQAGQVSESLFFNWGNALFKAGRIGRAIAAYQQAERMSPRDPDVRANLQFARNQVQGPTLLPERLARWFGKLTLNEWTWLAAIAFWSWLLLLAVLQLRPMLKSTLRSYTLWLGVAAAALGVGFSMAFYFARLEQRAIVADHEAVARQAPIEESQNAFTLHDGAELLVIDQKDQWLQVRVDPRRTGWVRKESLIVSPSS